MRPDPIDDLTPRLMWATRGELLAALLTVAATCVAIGIVWLVTL